MIIVNIDDREQERGFRAFQFFRDKTEIKPLSAELEYGDFVFIDDETDITVAFEYKTVEDFIASVYDNRVFNQALNQSNEFDYHFVMIVGSDKEKQEKIKEKQKYTGEFMTNKQFYGAMGSIVNISSIIQVPTEKSAFVCMERFAIHCCSLKPVLKRYSKSRGSPALRLLANNINGIALITAEKICDTLNLETIDDVFKLTSKRLCEVEGIGNKKAEKILSQLKKEYC